MSAARVRVVEEDAVAWAPGLDREAVEGGPHGEGHRSEMNGNVVALRHDMALAVEQRTGEVGRQAEQRRKRRAHDDRLHLGACRVEGSAGNFEGDRILVEDAGRPGAHDMLPTFTRTRPLRPTEA